MIKEVIYQELDIPLSKLNDFYFYNNILKHSDYFLEEYEDFEIKQNEIKNKAIKELSDHRKLDLSNSIFGISSIKNKAVLII